MVWRFSLFLDTEFFSERRSRNVDVTENGSLGDPIAFRSEQTREGIFATLLAGDSGKRSIDDLRDDYNARLIERSRDYVRWRNRIEVLQNVPSNAFAPLSRRRHPCYSVAGIQI